MTKDRAGGFIVLGGSMFFAEQRRIAELAAQSRLPSIYVLRQFAEAGGLMAYGPSIRDSLGRAASYVHRLVINRKTARALGLTIPPSLLQRADQVIE